MKNSPTTVIEADQIVRDHAIHRPDVRDYRKMPIGRIAHQGDVYLRRCAKVPKGFTVPTKDLQLAPGTTQGSRHIITAGPRVLTNPGNTDALLGPVIVAEKEFTLTHPEHAHCLMGPGVYEVEFQKDEAEAERRAVRD